jgi:hypothetical protein
VTPLVVASALLMTATGAWTLVLALASLPSHPATAVVLMAVSLWTATVASVTGMLVVRGRWARRLALAVTGAHGVVALIPDPDTWWGAAAILSCGAAIAVGAPWLNGFIRQRPAAAGPPDRAVLLPLVLLAATFLIGAAGGGSLTDAIVGFSAVVVAFWFIRALPGALVMVRLGWPLLALALAVPMGSPAGWVAAIVGLAVATLAWHETVRHALHPLVETGSRVPIPPELAPRDVLDAAEIDDRGRPR